MQLQHPDSPLQDWPIRNTDLGQAMSTLFREIKEEERMKKIKPFESTHKLGFEVAVGHAHELKDGWYRFRVGTCAGMWRSVEDAYEILAISNDVPGNGNLTDVFDWFENSCKRDKKNLRIREVWNKEFKRHLFKRYFNPEGENDMIKHFQ